MVQSRSFQATRGGDGVCVDVGRAHVFVDVVAAAGIAASLAAVTEGATVSADAVAPMTAIDMVVATGLHSITGAVAAVDLNDGGDAAYAVAAQTHDGDADLANYTPDLVMMLLLPMTCQWRRG